VRADILRAFGLKPWEAGLAPAPRGVHIRAILTMRRPRYLLRAGIMRVLYGISHGLADRGHESAARRIWDAMDRIFP
jgi:hypothetical protein